MLTKRGFCSVVVLAGTLLLGVGSVQAQVACQQQLVNPKFDGPPTNPTLAGWTPVNWTLGGPQLTQFGAAFHFGNPAFLPNSLSQTLGAPAYPASVSLFAENGDGAATWAFSVNYTAGGPTVTSFTHLGPGDPAGFPGAFGGIWIPVTPAFDPFRKVTSISITQTAGNGSPTCTDNYSVCGYRARDIDIKPGSFPNSINPDSKGNIPVALLSAPGFNATTCTSLTFGPNNAPALRTAAEDVDGDGDLDLVAHFATQATGITCSTTMACLTASCGGVATRGCDSVNPVPCP